ncbi:IS630 family transposase [Saccharopolyspora elongata]|uniref:IS630 family transposase n=1 Tax=Saccharopolyspora elongata TaxID=2530387 RepID=A0A4V2YJI5_9PSEU|nr:IS630 family transposase [Saccharopolyspora elongata]
MAQDQKNAVERGAWIVFFDESGLSLTPTVRRSWAPIGQTPVLEHRFNWKRASMAAALCYPPNPDDRRTPEVAFHVQYDSYNTETLIEVLDELRTFLAPQPVTLIWDGLPAHRSKAMTAFLATQADWLTVERLPAYAPDLNPVEALWSSVKGVELANLCPGTIDEAITCAQHGIDRVRATEHLPYSFLQHTGLSL